MRVIAGELGGRTLRLPKNATFRPTTDRVRESLFSILDSRLQWDQIRVCDLFAGSGSLGIEALSRGALSAVFVESDRRYAAGLQSNLAALDLGKRSLVITASVQSFLARNRERFDVVFADPPYDFTDYEAVLTALAGSLNNQHSMAVLEHRSDVKPQIPAALIADDLRNYGTTSLTFLRHPAGDA